MVIVYLLPTNPQFDMILTVEEENATHYSNFRCRCEGFSLRNLLWSTSTAQMSSIAVHIMMG